MVTAHDYLAMPDGPPYYQLIEGRLEMSPSPNWRHQDISGRIYAKMLAYVDEHENGRVFHAPLDVCLTEVNVFQPDVLFFSNARSPILGDRCIEGSPELVVEILSESTERDDKGPKRKVYAQTGVEELWLVDPKSKSVIVYDLSSSATAPRATHRGKEAFMSRFFPGLKFSCAEIFRGI